MKCKECGHRQKKGVACDVCGAVLRESAPADVGNAGGKKNTTVRNIIIAVVAIAVLIGGYFAVDALFLSGASENSSGEVSGDPNEAVGIAVKTQPTKMVYKVGEKFDDEGMKVSVLFGDNSEKTYVQGWQCTCADFNSQGKYLVTVKFKGLTTSFTVDVMDDPDNKPISIEVVKLPNKTKYALNERPDYTGLEVEATFADGSKKLVDVACYVHPFDQVGEYAVTVEYGELETTFNVHVH